MCQTLQGHTSCYSCFPYKDGFAIAATIVAGIAFLPSMAGYWGGLIPFAAFVLFMSTCCCSMTKGGFITTAVFGVFAALFSFGSAILYFAVGNDDEDSWLWNDNDEENGYNDDYYNIGRDEEDDDENFRPFRIIGGILIVGGVLWIVASVLLFVFICNRFDKVMQRQSPSRPVQATIVEHPGAAAAAAAAASVVQPPTYVVQSEFYANTQQPVPATIIEMPGKH